MYSYNKLEITKKKKEKNIYKKKYTTLSEQFRNSKHTKSTKLRLHTTVVD